MVGSWRLILVIFWGEGVDNMLYPAELMVLKEHSAQLFQLLRRGGTHVRSSLLKMHFLLHYTLLKILSRK